MRFAILSYSEKLWNVFEIVLEKCEVFVHKSLLLRKKIYFERKKNRRRVFVVYVSKFGGNRTYSLGVLTLYSAGFSFEAGGRTFRPVASHSVSGNI